MCTLQYVFPSLHTALSTSYPPNQSNFLLTTVTHQQLNHYQAGTAPNVHKYLKHVIQSSSKD